MLNVPSTNHVDSTKYCIQASLPNIMIRLLSGPLSAKRNLSSDTLSGLYILYAVGMANCRRSVGFAGAKLISFLFRLIIFFMLSNVGKDACTDKGTSAIHSFIRTLGTSCDYSARCFKLAFTLATCTLAAEAEWVCSFIFLFFFLNTLTNDLF